MPEAPSAPSPPARPRTRVGRTVLITVLCVMVIVGGLSLPFALRRFAVEAFKIPSGSMIPTLLVGDHIFVDKRRGSAERGDVIVFPFPEQPKADFVKRIVGIAGDRLEFHQGHPIINGVPVPSCLVGTTSYDDASGSGAPERHEGSLYVERLGHHRYLAFYDTTGGASFPDDMGPYVVTSGEWFVVGDNRNNAHDSRMWWGGKGGGVPSASVRGVAFVVWLSVSDRGLDSSRTWLSLDEPHLPPSMASLAPALERCLAEGPLQPG